ncbi:MAG: hypothetical protein AAFR47_17165 [Pseudomonadota bacterium]
MDHAREASAAKSIGFDACTLRRLAAIAEERRAKIKDAWHDYFG